MAEEKVLGDRRAALEDAFFKKEEEKKLAAYRDKLNRTTQRDQLMRASGMTDEAVLDHLIDLGVTGETAVALALVPLIHVALADGKLDDQEEKAILEAARAKGVETGSPTHEMLASWLASPDASRLFDAWKSYIGALAAQLSADELGQLETQVCEFADAVARAAGGFLGIGKVSAAEEKALAEIHAVFQSSRPANH